MFCSNCGQAIEEGKIFCKACGTPAPGQVNAHAEELIASRAAAMAAVPPATEETPAAEVTPVVAATPVIEAVAPVVTPSSPPTVAAVAPPPPAPPTLAAPPPPPPPPPAPGYGAGLQPPQGPTARRSNTGLIWGIVAAVIVVLAGAGVGSYFAFFHDGDDTTSSTTTRVSSSSTTDGVTSTTGGQTGTTVDGANTTQTIPSLTSTTDGGPDSTDTGPGTTEALLEAYLTACENIVTELDHDDARIPVLATTINSTAPGVPVDVRDELSTMMGTLDALNVELASLDVPPGFEDSYNYLEEAIMHMGNRIYATVQAVEKMWETGNVASANSLFEEGRTERDAYRVEIQKYYENLPTD
jgi:hypothetical protein